jgi:hypothetical protein
MLLLEGLGEPKNPVGAFHGNLPQDTGLGNLWVVPVEGSHITPPRRLMRRAVQRSPVWVTYGRFP